MAIGVVNDSDFEIELTKVNSVPIEKQIKESEVIDIVRGRGKNNLEVPDSLRKIIGETSEIDGRQSAIALARQFGISDSSVSAYSNGATSTSSYNDSKDSIRNHINKSKERISIKAKNKLVAALNGITPDKLANARLRDLSGLAKDMSGIIKDMEPDRQGPSKESGPQFIIYSPQFKKEEHFETIIVNE
jgi:hypothetical protein